MAVPGDAVRLLAKRLRNNLDVTMKQLAWNVLSYARQVTTDTAVSKGTTLASWVVGIGSVNDWSAPTAFAPYSWHDGNDLRNQYASWVRQSYTASMRVTFGIPFYISNSTPYLFENVNLNREYGGTNEEAAHGAVYAGLVSNFAQSEARRLFSSMPLDRMLYTGIVV